MFLSWELFSPCHQKCPCFPLRNNACSNLYEKNTSRDGWMFFWNLLGRLNCSGMNHVWFKCSSLTQIDCLFSTLFTNPSCLFGLEILAWIWSVKTDEKGQTPQIWTKFIIRAVGQNRDQRTQRMLSPKIQNFFKLNKEYLRAEKF